MLQNTQEGARRMPLARRPADGKSQMRIRPARPDEVTAIHALELDAARTYGRLPATAFCLDLPPRSLMEHEHVGANGMAFVAELDKTLIGFLLGVPVDGNAHILELGVAHDHQGRGYGRQLLARFEDWARDASYPEATLTTFKDVPWNAPFYARLGYQELELCADRPGLRSIRREEGEAGLDRALRVAMRKPLI